MFYKEFWSAGVSASESTFFLGAANSSASLLLAISAPILGSIADQGRNKKAFLAAFALLGILATAGLYFTPYGQWTWAIGLFAIASIGFAGANIFYDGLIVDVSPPGRFDFISAFGYALGYLGGGLLFLINVLMYLKPELFGLKDSTTAVLASFLTVSAWWALFSIPLFKNVRETQGERPAKDAVRKGLKVFAHTLQNLKHLKPLLLFLLAYLFYIDGINTIMKMAVDYGLAIGLESSHLITAILIVQFVSFPAAILFGLLGQKIGPKKGIYIGLLVYVFVTIEGYFMRTATEFYLVAAMIGLVQGGVQSLSRSYYARMIPKGQSAEFFGFYNMLGKFSAIVGPLLVGSVSLWTGNARLSILVVLIFFVVGGALLAFTKEQELPPTSDH